MQKPEHRLPVTAQSALSQLAKVLSAPDPVRDRLGPKIGVFCVGGAVRDAILGIANADLDFVVVGATVDEMLSAGFMPVGQDFPVFLHPVSHDEYALARTERKSGTGYKGFVFNASASVTLTEDLSRRDLTINAIAINQHGELIDPFHGLTDLQAGVFRHIGPAFSEDPVRLLRIARFAARWPGFTVAQETMALCKAMVTAGETRALVAERVWQEIQKGLMAEQPSRMLDLLMASGAWSDLHTSAVAPLPATMTALDQAAHQHLPLELRYAVLVFNHGSPLATDFFKAPRQCIDLAVLTIQQADTLKPVMAALEKPTLLAIDVVFDWLMQSDVVRKPDRFKALITALEITGLLTRTLAQDLCTMAEIVCSDAATHAVGLAAKTAQQSGQSIAQATRAARRDLLKTHPKFIDAC